MQATEPREGHVPYRLQHLLSGSLILTLPTFRSYCIWLFLNRRLASRSPRRPRNPNLHDFWVRRPVQSRNCHGEKDRVLGLRI